MGGGDDSGQDELNKRLQAEDEQQKAELHQKITSLAEERLNILKSGGAASWTPQQAQPAKPSQNSL